MVSQLPHELKFSKQAIALPRNKKAIPAQDACSNYWLFAPT
jgi:hypothetical protein